MDASVIVPAYNAEKSIASCLSSLKEQDFRGSYEIIVVNDGSRDRTAQIVKIEFPGVRLISQENMGPATARNRGAKAAKGEIIIFTDSDCVAKKSFVGEIARPFEDKKIAGVQGRYLSRQSQIVARFGQLEIEQRYEKMKKQKCIDFIGSYAAAYRKTIFDKYGGFDERFRVASGEDTDLSFRISRKHKFVFNDNAIVWHIHPAKLRHYLRVKFFRGYWRILVYRKHKMKLLADSYTSQMAKFGVLCFYGVLLFSVLLAGEYLALGNTNTVMGLGLSLCVLGMFATTLKFTAFALPKDWKVALAGIAIQLMKTAAIGLGTIYGVSKAALGKI